MPDLWEEGKPKTDDAENEERTADAGDAGDWGNAGRWGTFGNRPSYHREEIWKDA